MIAEKLSLSHSPKNKGPLLLSSVAPGLLLPSFLPSFLPQKEILQELTELPSDHDGRGRRACIIVESSSHQITGQGHLHPRKVSIICPPPPILLTFNSHSSQLPSPVHQGCSLKVSNVDCLRDLPLQAVVVDPSHPHGVPHVSSIVEVV